MDSFWKTFSFKNKGMLSLCWLWNRAIPMSKAHCPVGCWIGTKGKRGQGEILIVMNFFFPLQFLAFSNWYSCFVVVFPASQGWANSSWLPCFHWRLELWFSGLLKWRTWKKNHQEMPLYWFSISWNKWTHRIFCLQFSHYVSWLLRKTCLFLTYPTEKLSEISFKNAAFKKCLLMQPVH